MANRHSTPSGFACAEIALAGLLKKQATVTYSPLHRRKICRVDIEVGTMDVPVVAYNDRALELSKLPTATPVQIQGTLDVMTWTTPDDTEHELMLVVAKKITDG